MNWLVADGAARGFNAGVQNLVNIKKAGIELKRDQEKFDLDKKIANLQFEKISDEMTPEFRDARKKAMGLEFKMKDLQFETAQMAHDRALQGAHQTIAERAASLSTLQAANPTFDFKTDANGLVSISTKKQDDSLGDVRLKELALKSSTDDLGNMDPLKFDAAMSMLTKKGTAAPARVRMTGPDGNAYDVPAENVEKAKAKGFK